MCGQYSEGGTVKCGLNLCCSYFGWCGTDEAHCSTTATYGCQEGFGGCTIVPPPSCSSSSGSSSGRKVGYYQGANVRTRLCDRVAPSQINTVGFTHLNFAFVWFDPISFEMVPANEADVPLYSQFTALKSESLQTWVSVGGWDFTDPGPTENAFSNMVSTSANRAAFISSLMSFMEYYGFQGADLDWEYPAEVARGGVAADTENFVTLVQEMRAAFGTTYGRVLNTWIGPFSNQLSRTICHSCSRLLVSSWN
jgi:chitinase